MAASGSCGQNGTVGAQASRAGTMALHMGATRWHGIGKILSTCGQSDSGVVDLGMHAARGHLRRARGLPAQDLGTASRLYHAH
jgi:hypothetical protein